LGGFFEVYIGMGRLCFLFVFIVILAVAFTTIPFF
jgi:hypothetical protein